MRRYGFVTTGRRVLGSGTGLTGGYSPDRRGPPNVETCTTGVKGFLRFRRSLGVQSRVMSSTRERLSRLGERRGTDARLRTEAMLPKAGARLHADRNQSCMGSLGFASMCHSTRRRHRPTVSECLAQMSDHTLTVCAVVSFALCFIKLTCALH